MLISICQFTRHHLFLGVMFRIDYGSNVSIDIRIPGASPPRYSVQMDKLKNKKVVAGQYSDFVEK